MDKKILINKTLFSSITLQEMCLRDSLRAAYITLFLLCVYNLNVSFGQQGSLYLSVGYNKPWYTPTTIHVEQGELGNSYDMLKVKGDNKTNTPISFLHLNYRLGYFYDDYQLNGIEISFDPVNYAVKDNQNLKLRGIINNVPGITRTQLISKKNGSYYYLNGANLAMLNLVRRFEVYKDDGKKIRVDILAKGGIGPAFPHFENCLPINPVDDPQINWGGWNMGGELGVRVTGYRYFYAEVAGKYDYASFNEMKVFDGTAKQDLHTYMVVASIGFTLPTTKYNPLFHREHKIVTMLPFYQHKDLLGKKIENTNTAKKAKQQAELDSLSVNGLLDVPEFQDILDRKYKKEHPDTLRKVPIDSINNSVIMTLDTTGKFVGVDSLKQDSVMKSLTENPEHLSKRALKKKRKAEAKAKKAQEQKEAELQTPATGEKAPDAIPPVEKTPEIIPPVEKAPEVTPPGEKAPEVKDLEKKEPELSPKERKIKEKEEREAKKKAEEEQRAHEKAEREAKQKEEAAKAQQERDAKATADKELKAKEKEELEAKQKAEEDLRTKAKEEREAAKKAEAEQKAREKEEKAAKENEEKAKAREEKEAKKKAEEEQDARNREAAEKAKAQEKEEREARKQAEKDAKAKEKEEREARKKAEKEAKEKEKAEESKQGQ